jgi:hypothetical protein
MQQHLPSRKDSPLARQALLIAAVKIRNWIKRVAVARSLRLRALKWQAHFGLVNIGPRKTRRSAQVLHPGVTVSRDWCVGLTHPETSGTKRGRYYGVSVTAAALPRLVPDRDRA